jgi:hypothetical protein
MPDDADVAQALKPLTPQVLADHVEARQGCKSLELLRALAERGYDVTDFIDIQQQAWAQDKVIVVDYVLPESDTIVGARRLKSFLLPKGTHVEIDQ